MRRCLVSLFTLATLVFLDVINLDRTTAPFLCPFPIAAQFLGLGMSRPDSKNWYVWIVKYFCWCTIFGFELSEGPFFALITLLHALLSFSFSMDVGINSSYCGYYFCCSSYAYFFIMGCLGPCLWWKNLLSKWRWAVVLIWIGGLILICAYDKTSTHHAIPFAVGAIDASLLLTWRRC